jgi:glycerol-3-phosphate acyltransferase PlsY
MTDLIAVVAAYFLGSIPFSLLIARRRGVDLRTAGSGNVGATNVFRTAGVGPGIGALALDVAKGSAAVLIAARVGTGLAVPVAAAVAAIVGHVAPVWLRFRGGKGVATAAGAFAVLTPMAVGIAVATFLVTLASTRIVSLGSMVSALVFAVAVFVTTADPRISLAAAVTALIIVVSHRANLLRIIAGTESRVNRRALTNVR